MSVNRIEKQNLLEVFNLITTKGNKKEGAYELSGISASHDFDGYTCWLTYKDLTITLLFYGKYNFDYQEEDTLNKFYKKIAALIVANT